MDRNKTLYTYVFALMLGIGTLLPFAGCNALQALDGTSSGRIVVDLKGTAEGEMRMIDGAMMDCFDVDLIDPTTNRIIGAGTDCLDLNSISGGDPAVEGFAISNTTFFTLIDGTIKSRNRTTIQPVIEGSPGLTHITGDVPSDGNSLSGTGQYSDFKGVIRLSGAVGMTRFFDDNVVSFDCLFVIVRE